MALKKSIVLSTGVSADYWKVTDIKYFPKNSLSIYCSIYLDKVSKDGGKDAIDGKRSFSIDLPEGGIVNEEIIGYIYKKLKELDVFSGAEDA